MCNTDTSTYAESDVNLIVLILKESIKTDILSLYVISTDSNIGRTMDLLPYCLFRILEMIYSDLYTLYLLTVCSHGQF